MSRTKTSDTLQASLFALTQAAVGCGVGLLMAGRLGRPTQKITAATLFGLSALIATPVIVQVVTNAVSGPGSARGERKRLETIRTDSGFPHQEEIY